MAIFKNENGTAVMYSGSGGSSGHTILNPSGTEMEQREKLKFVGDSISVTDNSTDNATVVNVNISTDATPTQGSANAVQSGGTYTAIHATKPITEGGTGATDAATARANLGAGTSNFSGAYNDLTGKPTLGTAAAADTTTSITSGGTDVPTSGAVYTALQNVSSIETTTTDPGEGATMTSDLLIVYEE